jgi:hypothetical protein
MPYKKRLSLVTPAQIIELRGPLSQTAASHLCAICVISWQHYEDGEIAMSQAVFNDCRQHIADYHAAVELISRAS